MKKALKSFLCVLAAASTCTYSFPIPASAADTAFLERTESFEGFEIGDNWKESLPTGWKIQNSGDCTTSEIAIAQDPLNSNNKVLKLKGVEKSAANGRNFEKLIFQSSFGRAYAPSSDRNIVVSADMYIDPTTAGGLPTGANPGRDSAVIAGLATNSVGGTFTVSNLRRLSDTDPQTLIYTRMGKSGTDYFGSANTQIEIGKWVNVTHVVMPNDDGSFSYKQYIDGECVGIRQSGGSVTSDLRSSSYDGSANTSKVTNAYGVVLSVVSDALAEEGCEPTIYFDNIKMYEVDRTTVLSVTNLTDDEVLADFDTEADSFSLAFSAAVTEKGLKDKIYVQTESGEKKYADNFRLADDGLSAVVHIDNIDGLQAGTAYSLRIDKGLMSVDYFGTDEDFEINFTTKQEISPTPQPGDIMADITELINNDMESYEVGSDWLAAAPAGWTVSRSGGNLDDAAVAVAEDPTNSDNKCIMLTPGKNNSAGGETVRLMANTQRDVSGADCKKLITRVRVFIDPNGVDGFVKNGDRGLDGTALSGLAVNASGNSLFNVTTVRKDNETKIPYMYARTSASSSDWYADKMLELPTGRWFEVTHVADISDSGENAEFPVYTYKQYIDGVPTVLTYNKMDGKPQTADLHRNTYKGTPAASDYFNMFYGIVNAIAVTPNASAAPTVYFDDYYAAVIGDYSFGINNDTAAVEPYDGIEVEFPAEFDETNANYIKKSLSVYKVIYNEDGTIGKYEDIDGKITVETENNKIFKVKADDGLQYNSYYCVRLEPDKAVAEPYSIVDSFYQAIDESEMIFKTKTAKSVYVDAENCALGLNGAASIAEAEAINCNVRIINPDSARECVATCVIYGDDNSMIKMEYKTVSVSSGSLTVPFAFDGLNGKARKVGLYLFEKGNGLITGLMQVPVVIE